MGITVQVRFQGVSGLPEDVYVNTWHFDGAPTVAAAATIAAELEDFYNTPSAPSIASVGEYLSPVISRTAPVEMRFYDSTAAGDTGPPFESLSFTLDAANSALSFPEEVAAVLSSYSGPSSNQAEARARVFLGPLAASAGSIGGDGHVHLTGGFNIAVRDSAAALLADLVPFGLPWATRSEDPITGAVTFRAVDAGFIDNSFDTQRRRGIAPTGRYTFP